MCRVWVECVFGIKYWPNFHDSCVSCVMCQCLIIYRLFFSNMKYFKPHHQTYPISSHYSISFRGSNPYNTSRTGFSEKGFISKQERNNFPFWGTCDLSHSYVFTGVSRIALFSKMASHVISCVCVCVCCNDSQLCWELKGFKVEIVPLLHLRLSYVLFLTLTVRKLHSKKDYKDNVWCI